MRDSYVVIKKQFQKTFFSFALMNSCQLPHQKTHYNAQLITLKCCLNVPHNEFQIFMFKVEYRSTGI